MELSIKLSRLKVARFWPIRLYILTVSIILFVLKYSVSFTGLGYKEKSISSFVPAESTSLVFSNQPNSSADQKNTSKSVSISNNVISLKLPLIVSLKTIV